MIMFIFICCKEYDWLAEKFIMERKNQLAEQIIIYTEATEKVTK